MSDESSLRSVHLERTGRLRYRVENARGGYMTVGEGEDVDFSPVELLLAALGACNAITIEALTKRAEPRRFDLAVRAHKVRDADGGTHLENVEVTVDLRFESDEAGQKMADRVPDAIEKSHQRHCTVSRTLERVTPVRVVQVRVPQE